MSPKKEKLSEEEQKADSSNTTEMDYFAKVDDMRIPAQYFANLLTAGAPQPIRQALAKLVALRAFMRRKTVDGEEHPDVPEALGLSAEQYEDMYRLLAHHFDERTSLGFDDEEQNFVEGCKRHNLFGGM